MRLVAISLLLATAVLGCARPADTAAGSGPSAPAAETDAASDAVSTSSGSMASCVEEYSIQTLVNRKFAFDGTVTQIERGQYDDAAAAGKVRVSYDVNEWFAGGSRRSVTLDSWDFIVDGSSGDPELEDGTRVLVSGDTNMAWGCGFTRTFTSDEAEQWRKAFAG